MYPTFMLARNGGLRDTEIKTLTWGQINFVANAVQVGRAKSEAGEGRIVPLNSEVYQALIDHRAWYRMRFTRRICQSGPLYGQLPRNTDRLEQRIECFGLKSTTEI